MNRRSPRQHRLLKPRIWSFVVNEGCAECGFEAGGIAPGVVAGRVRSAISAWQTVLARTDAAHRPEPTTWSSPVEYAAHVRDLCRLMPARLASMLSYDDPTFDNWDQDRAAVEGAYWSQDPGRIMREVTDWALIAAAAFDAVTDEQQERSGQRSDGSRFTVTTLGASFVHELEHHLHDVGGIDEPAYTVT